MGVAALGREREGDCERTDRGVATDRHVDGRAARGARRRRAEGSYPR